jgi:SRSO17 transposase
VTVTAKGEDVTPADLAKAQGRLEAFVDDLLRSLRRRDQRAQAVRYLSGLLLDGPRKSIQTMAARLPNGNAQALDHFINHSPWDWRPIRQKLAERLATGLEATTWVLDAIDLPKSGRASVGVHRRYSRDLGKVVSCQRAVLSHAAVETRTCPMDWRLFLPSTWDGDAERRASAHVPHVVRHRPAWQLALDILDELRSWQLVPSAVVANTSASSFRRLIPELEHRGLKYVVRVEGPAPVAGDSAHRAMLQHVHTVPGYDALRVPATDLPLQADCGDSTWGSPLWLLSRRRSTEQEGGELWISNLPRDIQPCRLASLAGLSERTAQDCAQLRVRLGLNHFEGRSFLGWHHHVTLVSIAQAFLAFEGLPARAG